MPPAILSVGLLTLVVLEVATSSASVCAGAPVRYAVCPWWPWPSSLRVLPANMFFGLPRGMHAAREEASPAQKNHCCCRHSAAAWRVSWQSVGVLDVCGRRAVKDAGYIYNVAAPPAPEQASSCDKRLPQAVFCLAPPCLHQASAAAESQVVVVTSASSRFSPSLNRSQICERGLSAPPAGVAA